MNTATRSNVSAWARRFNVEIKDFAKACKVADSIYGTPSRRGAIYVAAMKAASAKFNLQMGNPITHYAAVAVTQVVYEFTYSNTTAINAHMLINDVFLEIREKVGEEIYLALSKMEISLVSMALSAVAARTNDHQTPSLVNAILKKMR